MAGTAKPNDSLITGMETTCQIISSSVTGSAKGLFDGVIHASNWNTSDVCYWGDSTKYVTIKFDTPCIIWRHSSKSYSGYTGKFQIYKIENDGTETDITSQIEQYNLANKYEWQKCMTIKEAGIYKFKATSALRLDTEWFLERTDGSYRITCCDQNNNEIYTKGYSENTPISVNDFPACQVNKVCIGYQKPDGTLFKNGDMVTENITLTPMFVDFEPITDTDGNIVAVKIKQEVYNLLKEVVDKYIIGGDEETDNADTPAPISNMVYKSIYEAATTALE